ncbi:hypothetical protein EJB05_02640, partial [Eragrostis curvula]
MVGAGSTSSLGEKPFLGDAIEEATEADRLRNGQERAAEAVIGGDPKRMRANNDDNDGECGADHEYMDEDDWDDDISYLDSYRQDWERLYGKTGSFEDETKIPNMVLTDGPELPLTTYPMDLLQIFSVKVIEIKGALQWPMDVYGHVAVRDSLDHKRIYLFQRKREDCQALASPQASTSSSLTNFDSAFQSSHFTCRPSRAIALIDPVIFEVDLKVKSIGSPFECDDEVLSHHAFCYHSIIYRYDTGFARKQVESTEHSTLEFMFAHLNQAVEATIQIRVDEGSSDFKARVATVTTGIDEEVVLLDSLDRA